MENERQFTDRIARDAERSGAAMERKGLANAIEAYGGGSAPLAATGDDPALGAPKIDRVMGALRMTVPRL
jgi:hypothetical protein